MTKSEEISAYVVMKAIIAELCPRKGSTLLDDSNLDRVAQERLCELVLVRTLSIGLLQPAFSTEFAAIVADATVTIQRLIRGYLGRAVARRRRDELDARSEELTRHFYAKVIQRCVRGYLFRKNNTDLRKRSNFLRELRCVNVGTAQTLHLVGKQNVESDVRKRAKVHRASTIREATRQHHLLSTLTRPSVFRPQYSDPILTDWGVPVETLIKHVYKYCVYSSRLPL